jgi:hypothetical protein
MDGSKNESGKMSNRISYSQQFETWVVEANLSTFAFESKHAAERFLDDLENRRERMFVDELGNETNETREKNCNRSGRVCECSTNCKTR